jgi:hypothetical protein
MRALLSVPDLVARVWPAQRVILGLRVSSEVRAALQEFALAVCYCASHASTAEQLEHADFGLFRHIQCAADVKLDALRDLPRLCAVDAALARAFDSGWEGPSTLELSGARALHPPTRGTVGGFDPTAVVRSIASRCSRVVDLHLDQLCAIGAEGARVMQALSACPCLERLRLRNSRFEGQTTTLQAALFSSLALATPRMQQLLLSNIWAASELGIAVSAALPQWRALTHLQLMACGLQAPLLKSPLCMPSCSNFARALTFQRVSCRTTNCRTLPRHCTRAASCNT